MSNEKKKFPWLSIFVAGALFTVAGTMFWQKHYKNVSLEEISLEEFEMMGDETGEVHRVEEMNTDADHEEPVVTEDLQAQPVEKSQVEENSALAAKSTDVNNDNDDVDTDEIDYPVESEWNTAQASDYYEDPPAAAQPSTLEDDEPETEWTPPLEEEELPVEE